MITTIGMIPPRVFEICGCLVMFASDVAKVFEVETRLINQNIKTNNKNVPPLFPEKYAFQLKDDEVKSLTSLGMMSKPTRGGSRFNPWVITRKGAIRLATLMKSPKAIQAADVFVDVFDEVISKLNSGQSELMISKPSRVKADKKSFEQINLIREKITHSIDDLLNTVINIKENRTIKDELGEVADEALDSLKEWLKSKRLSNDRIKAEALLIIEQTRDIYERRQSELATARIDQETKSLEVIEKKIAIVERLLKMYNDLEPNALIDLISGYSLGAKSISEETNE